MTATRLPIATRIFPVVVLGLGLVVPSLVFASVGAGAGLPYESVFAKILTSLTGPWAWTVSVVGVLVALYRGIERGGDLTFGVWAFVGPAFLVSMMLGVKSLMGFFGQGAVVATYSNAQPDAWVAYQSSAPNTLG